MLLILCVGLCTNPCCLERKPRFFHRKLHINSLIWLKKKSAKKEKRERGKEGKRERGKEGKRERGKEGKRERGKEGKRES